MAASAAVCLACASAADAKDKAPPAPAPAAAPAQPASPAAAPAAPRKATAAERAEAERLDPLARAAFWAHEVEVDGRDVQASVRLAVALRALGRNEEASVAVAKVLVIDPDDREALMEQARDFVAGGQGFYAIEPLKKLQARDARDWRIPSLMGVALEQVSREDEAEGAWRQALALSPDNPAVLSNLAMHEAAKGRIAEAETLLRKAAAQPAASLQVRQNLALVLGLQGKLAEAEQLQRQDLPPELADANMAYLRAASAGGGTR
jgi:Flp pilus assembly protein TadD